MSNIEEFKANKEEILRQIAKMLKQHFILITLGDEGGLALASTLGQKGLIRVLEHMLEKAKKGGDCETFNIKK